MLTLLARRADRFDRHRLATPNDEDLAAFTDKAQTRKLAQALGVPIAKASRSARRAIARALGLRLVDKPRSPYVEGNVPAKTSAVIVDTLAQLAETHASFGDRALLAESYFVGDGVGVSILANGGAFICRGSTAGSPKPATLDAASYVSASLGDPQPQSPVATMCDATKLTGVATFEFRHDTASGANILIGVNASFWESLPLPVSGGTVFPMAMSQMLGNDGTRGPERTLETDLRKYDQSGEWERLSDASMAPRSAPSFTR